MIKFQTRAFKPSDTIASEIDNWLMDPSPAVNHSNIHVEGYVVLGKMLVITVSFMILDKFWSKSLADYV